MGHVFYEEKHLLERLEGCCRDRRRPVVILVGSALTAPVSPNDPGVPGVVTMIERFQAAMPRKHVPSTTATNPYQEAVEALYQQRNQDEINQVIRRAVLEATSGAPQELLDDGAAGREEACKELEKETSYWPLNPGLSSLGEVMSQYPQLFGTVLTTNFDPLIEISLRKAGHEISSRTVLHSDGNPFQTEVPGCHVIYIHGNWRDSDTLHSPQQLQARRPKLHFALRRLLEKCTFLVLAYGGWDDAVTKTLVEVVNDEGAFPDVHWTFYSEDESKIENQSTSLLKSLEPGIHRRRVALYRGVDCHSLLPKLRQRLVPLAAEARAVIVLPEKELRRSPFTVGAPIRRDEDFLDREPQIDMVRDAIDKPQPVQILGERRMGKTSFLLWLERNVPKWRKDFPVAFVWAQGQAGRSPAAFVHEVAQALGRAEEIEEQLKHGGTEVAAQALGKLLPVLILVDEAANLAKPEHGFHSYFLDTLRDFGQRGELIWISASHRDLRKLFVNSGTTSAFLNDARLVSIGQLEDNATRELVSRLEDEKAAELALEQAGSFAFGLQWIADELWRKRLDRKTVPTAYSLAMEIFFQAWWAHRTNAEQRLLHKSIEGLRIDDLDKHERRQALNLQELGLLVERADSFHLPGLAWRSFVKDLPDSTTG